MKSPLFSIIVPIYGVEKYLEKCLDSILNQVCDDFELILVDDGSIDDCPQICDEYAGKDNRVTVIHKKNGGLVSARKAGAKVAIGDYIICVDGDDWIESHYLENFEEIIKRHRPEMICCGYKNVTENGKILKNNTLKYHEGLYERGDIIRNFFPCLIEDSRSNYFPPSVWAKAMKRELYLKCQMSVDDKISVGEDVALVEPFVFRSRSIYISHKNLYNYVYNGSSITKSGKVYSIEDQLMVIRHLRKHIDVSQYDFMEQICRRATHYVFNVIVSQFNSGESYRQVKKDINNILKRRECQKYINKCKFAPLTKGEYARLALKHRWIKIIYIYYKIQS